MKKAARQPYFCHKILTMTDGVYRIFACDQPRLETGKRYTRR